MPFLGRSPSRSLADVIRQIYFEKVHKGIYYGRLMIKKTVPEKNIFIHFKLDRVQSVHYKQPSR